MIPLSAKTTVFQRAVVEFALLVKEWQIEIAMLITQLIAGPRKDIFGHCVMSLQILT